MSKDTFILHEWKKEKMDKLKEMARLEDAKPRVLNVEDTSLIINP